MSTESRDVTGELVNRAVEELGGAPRVVPSGTGDWEGQPEDERTCSVHYSLGPDRAWCYSCQMVCFRRMMCDGCEQPDYAVLADFIGTPRKALAWRTRSWLPTVFRRPASLLRRSL